MAKYLSSCFVLCVFSILAMSYIRSEMTRLKYNIHDIYLQCENIKQENDYLRLKINDLRSMERLACFARSKKFARTRNKRCD